MTCVSRKSTLTSRWETKCGHSTRHCPRELEGRNRRKYSQNLGNLICRVTTLPEKPLLSEQRHPIAASAAAAAASVAAKAAAGRLCMRSRRCKPSMRPCTRTCLLPAAHLPLICSVPPAVTVCHLPQYATCTTVEKDATTVCHLPLPQSAWHHHCQNAT